MAREYLIHFWAYFWSRYYISLNMWCCQYSHIRNGQQCNGPMHIWMFNANKSNPAFSHESMVSILLDISWIVTIIWMYIWHYKIHNTSKINDWSTCYVSRLDINDKPLSRIWKECREYICKTFLAQEFCSVYSLYLIDFLAHFQWE